MSTASDLFKKLAKAASTYDVKRLHYAEKPKQRPSIILDWVHSMVDVTFTQPAILNVLQDYPVLPTNVDPDINMVLSQLFRAYLARNVKPYIAAVTPVDGIGILARLQKVFAPLHMLTSAVPCRIFRIYK